MKDAKCGDRNLLEILDVEKLLSELVPMLDGWNYSVFLRIYRVPFVKDAPAEWYIAESLGPKAVVGNVFSITCSEMLTEVEQSIRFAGDAGSGPKPENLRSQKYEDIVLAVMSEVKEMSDSATLLSQFWLKDGHPAYPVFWDFAYVIAGPSGGVVFVGSSSD